MKIFNSAVGLGDSICGLYAACGLAQHRGYATEYQTKHWQWLLRVQHKNLFINERPDPVAADAIDMDGDWKKHYYDGTDRKQYYCDSLSSALENGTFRPLAPDSVDRETRPPEELFYSRKNVVLLSPFSASPVREWDIVLYARLAELLLREGFDVVAIAACFEKQKLQRGMGFLEGKVPLVADCGPEKTAEMICAASCVVGNDSGITHLSGLLQTPTVAIHSHMSPQALFSHTKITSVTPDTDCRFCRWRVDRGFSHACNLSCSALNSISPEKVFQATKEAAERS